MSKSIYLGANVETTDTFSHLLARTNQIVYDMGTVVLTAGNVAQPNTVNGAMTSGNTHLQGTLSSTTLAATTALRGGTVSVPANLIITSNTIFSQSNLVHVTSNTNNFTVDANNTTFTSNVNINNVTKRVNIKAANTTIDSGGLFINVDTTITTPTLTANVDTFTIGTDAADTLNVKSVALFNENVTVSKNLVVSGTANVSGVMTAQSDADFKSKIYLTGASERSILTKSNTTAYRPLALTLENSVGSTVQPIVINSTNVSPAANTTFDLGTPTLRWKTVNTRDVSVSGNTQVVSFTASANSFFLSNLDVAGDMFVNGRLVVSGTQAFTTSKADIDNLVVYDFLTMNAAARIDSDFIPATTGVYDLGSTASRWDVAYTDTLNAKNAISLTGNTAFTTSITTSGLTANRTVTLPNANVTLVDGTMVPTTRNLIAGDGIVGGGALDANRTFAVDTSVVRTSGAQTIAGTKTFSSTISGSVNGNSATATQLQTSRTINGVAFDGSTNISINATSPNALTAGDGFTGGTYDGSTVRTFGVDSTVVRTSRNINSGDGIAGGGALNADRTLSVDGTVVRTSGDQNIGGFKRFTSDLNVSSPFMYMSTDDNRYVVFRNATSGWDSIVGYNPASTSTRLVTYNADNATVGAELRVNRSGDITAHVGRFAGSGSGLTNIPATALTGTISDSRQSTNVALLNNTQTFSGKKTFSSTIDVAGVESTGEVYSDLFRAALGSNATPTYSFRGDTDTGIYSNIADSIRFATGGVYRGEVNNTGFKGDGSQLTSLNASNVTTGSFSDARLSVNVILSYGNQSISGLKTFTSTMTAENIIANNTVRVGNGSATVPTLSFGSDNNTGIYSDAENVIRFTAGAVYRAEVNTIGFKGDGSQLTNLQAGDIASGTLADARLSGNVVFTGRQVIAGNGLTGGGNFAANRTITLGTPETITHTSGNTVSAAGHTHNIGEGTIRLLIAQGFNGGIGTYAFCFLIGSTNRDAGFTTAGSNLRYSNADAQNDTAFLPGTWRLMGRVDVNTELEGRSSVWLRIS